MENSSEQSRWVSPSLISPDQLANYTTEHGLLPPGEDDEPFYSSSETDLLPSYYSTGGQSRASSSYRHSPGEILSAAFKGLWNVEPSLPLIKWYCKFNKRSGRTIMEPLFCWFPRTIHSEKNKVPKSLLQWCHKRAILVSPNNLSMNSWTILKTWTWKGSMEMKGSLWNHRCQ